MHTKHFIFWSILSIVSIHAFPFQPRYTPLNPKQEKLDNYFRQQYSIVIAEGTAGTGKTLLATQYALQQLHDYKKKVVITRPTILTGTDIGYLPGSLNEKMQPWMMPILDVLAEFYPKDKINQLFREGRLEIVPLGFMRGRSFKHTILLADEMQNSTPEQMKMLLTRIGLDSKILITGDIQQTDIHGSKINGLQDLLERLSIHYRGDTYQHLRDGIATVHLDVECVERHPVIPTVLTLYDQSSSSSPRNCSGSKSLGSNWASSASS